MGLEIGNKVLVLDDVIEGVVFGFKSGFVVVKDDLGMLYEFKSSELVKVDDSQSGLLDGINTDFRFLKDKINIDKRKKPTFKKVKKEVVMEVDLHINKLVKSTKGLDNYDMLTLQIDTAKRKIEYCIKKRISKIVFIHGVGAGVLKTELHFLLNKYPVKFYDASYQQYGLGATEVYIFQNGN